MQDSSATWCRALLWLPALLLAGEAIAAVGSDSQPTPLLELRSAQFAAPNADGPERPAAQHVGLPHRWSMPGGHGVARYRLEFTLAGGDRETAVLLEATLAHVEAHLNGTEVFRSTAGDPYRAKPLRSWKMSPSFALPAQHLVAGVNVLEIVTFKRPSGAVGLGPVWVGDSNAVAHVELRLLLRDTVVPLVIAAVIVTLGLFALVLARDERDRALFLLFGVGGLLWGVHTAVTLLPEQPLPNPHYAVLWYAGYVWFAVALSVFCVRFAQRRWIWFERVGAVAAVAAVPLLYALWHLPSVAGPLGIVLAGCILYALIALGGVVAFAFERRDFDGWLLLAVGILSLSFSIYDWLLNNVFGQLLRPFMLTPYAGLAFIALAGWMLVERYRRTATAYRNLNSELEARVRAAQAELLDRLGDVERARDVAERASVAKSRFFAAASHDLRQPLHALAMYTDALDEYLVGAAGAELRRRIGESISALDSLFEELLDLSRLDARIIEVKPGAVDTQALFDRLDGLFHREATDKGLRLRFVPTRLRVESDPLLLERTLSNLISNALRYTQRGGVLVGARRRGAGWVWLEVRDSGIGIPAEEQQRVFDEFYQIGNPGRDRRHGFGLGLAIVRRLAALLDHRVELWSEPGRGTRFRIVVRATQDAPVLAPADGAAIAVDRWTGKRVLVVDDDSDICDATVRVLTRWGIEATAVSGIVEIDAASASGERPDLVIVDLRLGDRIDGVDVIGLLRARYGADLPALLISGDTGARELARVQASGVPLLIKPVPPARLRAALQALFTAPADPARSGAG